MIKVLQHAHEDDDGSGWPELHFNGTVEFGAPMVVEAVHALREARVARMTLAFHGDHDRRHVDVCDVRSIRVVRVHSRWWRRAMGHKQLVADAVYAEMWELFVTSDQRFKDLVATVTVTVATGEVKVSNVRFAERIFAFEGWKNAIVLR
jgi:hypothetical protein